MKTFRNIKVLSVSDKQIIGARGFDLVRYNGLNWEKYASLSDTKSSLLAKFRIIQRLTRAEINKHYILKTKTELCIARKGIFRKEPDESAFNKCFAVPRGSRPLNICEHDGWIYFGEYFQNVNKEAVHIYGSSDDGKTWKIVYTFQPGVINHIHGIFKDSYTQSLYVVTGDGENECIIAKTSNNFQTIDVEFRGSQQFRTCNLFFYPDFICFATDTELAQNYIKRIDRRTHNVEIICKIQGTAIKGGQVGNVSFLSTTVEPSRVNKDNYSHLWVSFDGMTWRENYSA